MPTGATGSGRFQDFPTFWSTGMTPFPRQSSASCTRLETWPSCWRGCEDRTCAKTGRLLRPNSTIWANPTTPLTCPLAALERWLLVREAAADTTGGVSAEARRALPLFCGMSKAGRLSGTALSDKAVARLVKTATAAAGLDPEHYSGHSLRAAWPTRCARPGINPSRSRWAISVPPTSGATTLPSGCLREPRSRTNSLSSETIVSDRLANRPIGQSANRRTA